MTAAPPRPPLQFRLADLMLVIGSLSVVLSLMQLLRPTLVDAVSRRPPLTTFLVFSLLAGLFHTAPLGGVLGMVVYGWRKEATFPTQPGHWLLVQSGLAFAERVFSLACVMQHNDGWRLWPVVWLPSCILAIASTRRFEMGNWMITFWLLANLRGASLIIASVAALALVGFDDELARALLPFLGISVSLVGFGSLLLSVAVLAAAVREHQDGVRRGWLHNLGVTMFALEPVALWFLLVGSALTAAS